jgi:hypothetical protein
MKTIKFRRSLLTLLCGAVLNLTVWGQTTVQPKVLNNTEWQEYFTRYFNLKDAETLKTTIATTDIPFPAQWKYAPEKGKKNTDKYRVYTLGTNDYMTMPSNNGVGTYLFFFDHKSPANDWVEMNFVADSISCIKLSKDIFMFKFNNNEFKIQGDSSGFNRYVFTDKNGHIATKAILAHDCSITLNSVDSLHHTIYLNVVNRKKTTCLKCMQFDYKNFLLLSAISNADELAGTIVIDAVHYCFLKKVEALVN